MTAQHYHFPFAALVADGVFLGAFAVTAEAFAVSVVEPCGLAGVSFLVLAMPAGLTALVDGVLAGVSFEVTAAGDVLPEALIGISLVAGVLIGFSLAVTVLAAGFAALVEDGALTGEFAVGEVLPLAMVASAVDEVLMGLSLIGSATPGLAAAAVCGAILSGAVVGEILPAGFDASVVDGLLEVSLAVTDVPGALTAGLAAFVDEFVFTGSAFAARVVGEVSPEVFVASMLDGILMGSYLMVAGGNSFPAGLDAFVDEVFLAGEAAAGEVLPTLVASAADERLLGGLFLDEAAGVDILLAALVAEGVLPEASF